jgi:hypothetical protein
MMAVASTEHDHYLLELTLAHLEAEEELTAVEAEVKQHGYLDGRKERLEAAERKVEETEAVLNSYVERLDNSNFGSW